MSGSASNVQNAAIVGPAGALTAGPACGEVDS